VTQRRLGRSASSAAILYVDTYALLKLLGVRAIAPADSDEDNTVDAESNDTFRPADDDNGEV
jgi:hypothetical protein